MYNPAFQDVNNQPNKLDLEKHWLKYILVHIHQQLPMDYLDIKMAVKKSTEIASFWAKKSKVSLKWEEI